jgi:hypothetical protein
MFFSPKSRTVAVLQERELSMKMMNAREAEVQRNENAIFFNLTVFGIFRHNTGTLVIVQLFLRVPGDLVTNRLAILNSIQILCL